MPKLSQVRLTKRMVEAAQPGQCISDNEVRGFRLIVSPSGTRRFVFAYKVWDGERRKSSMKAIGSYPSLTVEQARELAQKQLTILKGGKDPHESERAARKAQEAIRTAPTLGDLAKVYLEDYAVSQALRTASVHDARSLLAKVPHELQQKKVAEIGITDIRKLHGDVRAAGIAAGTKGVYRANRLLAILSKMFSLAIERGWRLDNPCRGVRKYPEDQRWRNLTQAEVNRLLTACDDYEAGLRPIRPEDDETTRKEKTTPLPPAARSSTDREAADAIRLLLFTGARLREVLKAEWPQFDLERGLWEKPSAHTKTKRQHRLELEGPALDLLNVMAKRKSHPVYLFPGSTERRRRDAPIDIQTGQPKGITPRADLKRPWRHICEDQRAIGTPFVG